MAEISEGRCGQTHPVKTALIQPMRGGFHREMRHTIARKMIKRLVQTDRIRRCERAIMSARATDHTNCADARGVLAAMDQNLACEIHHRSLAARPCNRKNFRGLGRIKTGCCLGKCETYIRHMYINLGRHPRRSGERFPDNGNCTRLNRGSGELSAIRPRTRHRKKHHARTNLTAIRRHACNVERAD